eukprot:gene29991-37441_t
MTVAMQVLEGVAVETADAISRSKNEGEGKRKEKQRGWKRKAEEARAQEDLKPKDVRDAVTPKWRTRYIQQLAEKRKEKVGMVLKNLRASLFQCVHPVP